MELGSPDEDGLAMVEEGRRLDVELSTAGEVDVGKVDEEAVDVTLGQT